MKSSKMSVLHTPDACFDNLPLWDYEPQYFTSTLYGLEVRIAYYDLGEKGAEETILLTHGMSAWSYLYRRMIPPFVGEGHRVILFDQVGCGRSDKPSREEDYTYERHIGWNIDLLINHLRLKGVTVVLQDWGGLIGTRVVAAHPGAFRRLVIANTMLPTCDDSFFKVSPGFYSWKTFAFRTGLKDDIWMEERGGRWPGQIMAQKAVGPSNPKMDLAERAAYDAPYPDDTYKAGARMLPELVPTPPTDPTGRPMMVEAENNAAAWSVFQKFTKPVLLAFSDEDTVMAGGDAIWLKHCPGTKHPGVEHITINGVGHFLQDGGADQLLGAIAALISATPPASIAPLRAGPLGGEAAITAKAAAEAAASERAVAHGDFGISTPSDGGASFIAPTPEGRTPYCVEDP
jgi:haloalkane dehalogenase